MILSEVANKVGRGATVTFTAHGNSMAPLIKNGAEVTVEPRVTAPVKGQIVLAKVHGKWFLHKVTAVKGDLAQISNNKGHINGWCGFEHVVGVLQKKSPSRSGTGVTGNKA